MTGLDLWLKNATRHLSKDSGAQVRREILEHYESARESAIHDGVPEEMADQLALGALGDPRQANRQYRKVLLTSAEARLLRESNWEARTVCSFRLLKPLLLGVPLTLLLAALVLFYRGSSDVARTLLAGSIAMGFLFLTPYLPVFTPSRSRIIRYVRWAVLAGMMTLAFGPDILKNSWLLFSCLWPIVWVEWTRMSIRRKLPVAQWPRHLYL